jgi:hypothetical protein
MITIDCPWCEATVHMDGREAALRCDGCSVEVELAPDEAAVEVRRAA